MEDCQTGVAEFAEVLPTISGLQSIRLGDNEFTTSEGVALGRALAKLRYLEVLDLSGNRIDDKGICSIADGLAARANPETLKRLDLSNNYLNEKEGLQIAWLMRQSPMIESINLSWNRFGEDAGAALGDSLSAVRVTELYISDSGFGPRGVAAVCRSLKAVRALNVSHNDAGSKGARAISRWLRTEEGAVEDLDLGENCISGYDAKVLSRGLAANHSLRRLRLEDNPLGPFGVSEIFSSISRGRHRLHEVCVCGCRAEDEGAKAVARFVSGQDGLRSVCMSRNGIGPAGAKAICAAVSRCAVDEVSLEDNPLDDEGVIWIAEKVVRGGTAVKKLYMRRVEIGGKGMMALATAIAAGERSALTRICVTARSENGPEEFLALTAASAKARPGLEVVIC